jgi:hypothetical protein
MEDGRLFTNYLTNANLESNISKENNLKTNEDYRRFLMNNASRIMEINKINQQNQTYNYSPNNDPNHLFMKLKKQNNAPHLYDSVHDTNHVYGYETNNVKEKYLSRQQLNAKTFNKYKK